MLKSTIEIQKLNFQKHFKQFLLTKHDSYNFFRAILFYPESLFVGMVATIMVMITSVLGFLVHEHLGSLRNEDGVIQITAFILKVFNVMACYWWCMFIVDFSGLIARTAFITWYSAENKETLTKSEINSQVFSIVR